MSLVDCVSNHMKGKVIQLTIRIGPATNLAIFSGDDKPMRFGISSPKTNEK